VKGKSSLAIFVVLLLIAPLAAAKAKPKPVREEPDWENTVLELEMKMPFHMGDEIEEHWAAPRPLGVNHTRAFWLGGVNVKQAWMDMQVYEINRRYDALIINNVTIANLRGVTKEAWSDFNVSIPVDVLKEGKNNITFRSSRLFGKMDYDDYQIKDLKLYVEYARLPSNVVAIKSVSKSKVFVGERVEVNVTVTNIGTNAAFNVTAFDIRPSGVLLISGDIKGKLSPMAGGNVLRIQYVLMADKPGDYKSIPGRFEYFDDKWKKREGVIEATTFTAIPAKPEIHVTKNVTGTDVVGGQLRVKIVIENTGNTDVHNVRISDPVPGIYEITEGKNEAGLELLRKGDSFTHYYNITPEKEGLFSIAADVTYEDLVGESYSSSSNYIKYVPLKGLVPGAVPATTRNIVIGAIAFVIVLLLLLIIKLRFF